ncbi:hypothetical protein IDH30_02570 [Pelagibacterales bacterium SAG-MED15]|nr:hypothetical protein [Pelagibacterales bacterium SAG-MED15]
MKFSLIITNYNQKYGYGHYNRSKRLYDYLKKNVKIRFTSKPNKNEYKNYDNLIFDLPDYKNFLKGYKVRRGQKIIALDYNGKEKIDINYAIFSKSKNALLNYVSLENTFIEKLKFKKKNRQFSLIALGGYDRKKESLKIAKNIIKLFNIKVLIVYGPLNKKKTCIKEKKIKIIYNPKNFKKIQSECKFAVTNGGLTLKEMLSLKKSVFAIPQTPAEKKLCKKLKKHFKFNYGNISNLKFEKFKSKTNLKFKGLENFKKIL